MTRKTYCGNLLWQPGLTLLAPYDKENLLWQFTVAIRSDPVGSGAYYNDLPFVKTGIDEVDYPAWDSNVPGRALDEDGIAPNNNDMTWRY